MLMELFHAPLCAYHYRTGASEIVCASRPVFCLAESVYYVQSRCMCTRNIIQVLCTHACLPGHSGIAYGSSTQTYSLTEENVHSSMW